MVELTFILSMDLWGMTNKNQKAMGHKSKGDLQDPKMGVR
jgi:hypothetical protein